MSRYQLLKDFKQKNGKAVYLPYVLLGFPNADVTEKLCKALIEEGVHGFELGLPFRDPVADGPVIQQAANEALDAGFKISQAVELVRRIRAIDGNIPLTLMSYYNMVFARGTEQFLQEFSQAGIDGILIPDMPPERAGEVAPLAEKHGIKLVFIAAPNSSDHRLNLINQHANAFIYVVTRMGVTGINESYSDELSGLFNRLHQHIDLPAIAGFGISEPAQAVKMIEAGADGVITGSKLVELVRNGWDGDNFNDEGVRNHTKKMLEALSACKLIR